MKKASVTRKEKKIGFIIPPKSVVLARRVGSGIKVCLLVVFVNKGRVAAAKKKAVRLVMVSRQTKSRRLCKYASLKRVRERLRRDSSPRRRAMTASTPRSESKLPESVKRVNKQRLCRPNFEVLKVKVSGASEESSSRVKAYSAECFAILG